MTPAKQNLFDAISDITKFVSHNVGVMRGTTTGFEVALLRMGRAKNVLTHELEGGSRLPAALDDFESAFMSFSVLSAAVLNSTNSSAISDKEIDTMLLKIDNVRDEINKG